MQIETSRLILRGPELQDFNEFWLMVNDPVAKEFTGGVSPYAFNEQFILFKKDCEVFLQGDNAVFAVIEKVSNKYIGYCGFKYCNILNDIEILYGYCQSAWGRDMVMKLQKLY